jgi:hypothetical protein
MLNYLFYRSPELDVKDVDFPFPIHPLVLSKWKALGPIPHQNGFKIVNQPIYKPLKLTHGRIGPSKIGNLRDGTRIIRSGQTDGNNIGRLINCQFDYYS